MISEYHSFVDEDAGRCGAILRRLGPGLARTRTVFRMADDAPVYLVDHVLEYDGAVGTWTRYRVDSSTAERPRAGSRAADGTVDVDGVRLADLRGALPGYAEHLVLLELLADDRPVVSFRQFDDAAPEDGAEDAELHRLGPEAVALADGTVVEAERVQLVVPGRPSNAHWCRGGVVLVSDWCGARSYRTTDPAALVAGLDDEVATLVREFDRG